MKATIEFDLPEDHEEYLCTINGTGFLCVILAIERFCRNAIKYSDKPEQYLNACEEIRELIRDEFDENDIPLGLI